ncbi:MAG: EAL domain-containing protein [Lachnospiraceae bacterium]|nr:EAL domain-containing protein [Lachnospiraceae bacterium]
MYIYLMYNLCAVLALATLILALVIRGLYKGRNNRLFLLFCVVLFLAGIFDIASEYLDHFVLSKAGLVPLRYFLNLTYYILHNLMAPLYFLYIASIMGIWHKLRKAGPLMYLWLVPYNVDIILLIINVANHRMFYFDGASEFRHGPWFMTLYVVAFYYMFFEIGVLIYHRRLLSGALFWLLLLFLPLNALAVIIQYTIPSLRIEIFATTIMCTGLAILVHRPEDMVDEVMNMQSYKAFLGAVHRDYTSSAPISYLMIRISNYRLLRRSLGMNNYIELIRTVATRINQISASVSPMFETYYLEQGSFVISGGSHLYDLLLNAGHAINSYVSRPVALHHMEVMLETSICLVRCPDDMDTEDKLLNFEGTYNTKLPQADRVVCISELLKDPNFRMRNDMDNIISRAIEKHKFSMYYQPIYSVEKGKFSTAEALIRLTDEEYGFVSPGVFIPAAEDSGAIHDIGDYVIDEVCRFISTLDFDELGLDYIEINLSAAQCIENDLYEKVRASMDKYGVRPDQVNLEITETAADYDPEVTDRNIGKLSEDGIRFSLDDYGTGYSNISRVVQLPLDIVKLDKSLVDDMDIPSMWAVICNTVRMLKRMNKKILVEGVEDKRALRKFIDIGCDYIQGFYFSKPIPEKDYINFVREKNSEQVGET